MNTNANKRYFKKNKPVTLNNQFQKQKIVNPVLTMEFPVFTSLVATYPTEKVGQIQESSTMYKNIVETECKIHVKDDNKGYITLKDQPLKVGSKDSCDIIISPFHEVDLEVDLDVVASVQRQLDTDHERYKKNYIELYGQSEYNRNYTMTESHLYHDTDDDNEEEMDMDYESE